MIRINLLGQARPKAARRPVPLEATLQVVLLLLAVGVAAVVLVYHWWQMSQDIRTTQAHIQKQMGEKARLEQLKAQVDAFERQRAVLQQRISIIEELQRNRTGGEALLDALANTVSRTDTLWLTQVSFKGGDLTMQGEAGSIAAVANFITQLKRSGYFQQVDIKETHQDDRNVAVQAFLFTLTAQFAQPGQPAPPAKPGPPATKQG